MAKPTQKRVKFITFSEGERIARKFLREETKKARKWEKDFDEDKIKEYVFRICPVAYFPKSVPLLTANQEQLFQEFYNYITNSIEELLAKERARHEETIKDLMKCKKRNEKLETKLYSERAKVLGEIKEGLRDFEDKLYLILGTDQRSGEIAFAFKAFKKKLTPKER